MQIVRTILWVLLAVFIVIFVMLNYGEPQRVKIWVSEDPIGFDWPVGIIALVFWLLGVIPTWLYHRSVKWSLGRRIRSLENSIKSNALSRRDDPAPAPSPATPAGTSVAVDKPAENPVEPEDTLAPSPNENDDSTGDRPA
ncbi:MAG: LapA family protein [Erythrobacter sp.]